MQPIGCVSRCASAPTGAGGVDYGFRRRPRYAEAYDGARSRHGTVDVQVAAAATVPGDPLGRQPRVALPERPEAEVVSAASEDGQTSRHLAAHSLAGPDPVRVEPIPEGDHVSWHLIGQRLHSDSGSHRHDTGNNVTSCSLRGAVAIGLARATRGRASPSGTPGALPPDCAAGPPRRPWRPGRPVSGSRAPSDRLRGPGKVPS